MIAIRKFGWSVLVLAAFAGCGTQENEPATPATPGSTETAPAPGNVPAPTPPAETKPESAPAPSTEPGKADAATPDMPKDAPAIQAPQPTPATKDDTKPQDKSAAVSLSSDEVAAIKKLPAAEAETALKQAVCPVSGEHLGSMDVPVKVKAAGQTFYLCCDGCNKEVKSDPAAVVAKLKK